MLLVDNDWFEARGSQDLVLLLCAHPSVVSAAQAFSAKGALAAPLLGKDRKCVHVLQREVATVDFKADDAILASDDATTCTIVAVVSKSTGMASIAHFDEATSLSDLCLHKLLRGAIPEGCSEAEGDADLYLVGGMAEDTGVGLRTAGNLLRHLQASSLRFHVRLACVHALNTLPCGGPVHKGLALDPLTGWCTSADAATGPVARRGPLLDERLAHFWVVSQEATDLMEIHDARERELVVMDRPPFAVTPALAVYCAYLLTLEDGDLLSRTSTTPAHEGPGFIGDVRRAAARVIALHDRRHVGELPLARRFRWEGAMGDWQEVGDMGGKGKGIPAQGVGNIPSSKSTDSLQLGTMSRVSSLSIMDGLGQDIDIPGSSWSVNI